MTKPTVIPAQAGIHYPACAESTRARPGRITYGLCNELRAQNYPFGRRN
jgi:hypothetical protein